MVAFDVLDVDDVRGAVAELRYLRLTRRNFPVPGMLAAADIGPRAADPGDARTRQVTDLGASARPEREHVEPVVAGAEGVRLLHDVDDAVARAYRERSVVLQANARAAEDVEDLLFGCLPVIGRRPLPRIDPDPLQPDRPSPGCRAEVAPLAPEMARLSAAAVDLVPMRKH